jgi:Zn-dependent protease
VTIDQRQDRGQPEPPRSDGVANPHGSSASIGSIAGIPIRVHWTFALLIGLVVVANWDLGRLAVADGILWIVALFAFVVAHEISHCLVARRRGARVLGIILIPLGGLSQLEAMPEAPRDEFAVAIAGPVASLGLGLALMGVALGVGVHVWPPTLFAGSWLVRLAWLNLLLGAFNMLPALPMDGGRVLRATLARNRSSLEATLLASRISRYAAGAMVVFGLFYDFWLVLIGLFVLMGSNAEVEIARREHHEITGPRRDEE